MALVLNDRVRETTIVVGTGPATLLGTAVGYESFSVVGNGNTCYYCISDQGGANWEVGIGTYDSATPALARTTVLASSNADALVSFIAGTKDVFVTYPAETAVSGGGGGTYPTIRPTLNLDFANTKQLDPRITFVRNSTAAYYDGQTTALAEQNLLLQSNTFSNAAWVATNGTVASGVTDPAGTTTAFSFTATGVATLYQTLTTSATPYTLSFYIQRVTGTGAVNLTLDGTTLTAQTITGSWARYSVTATPTAASHTIGIQLAVITDSVNIFSSQLENRSSMTAANITTTAAITNYIPVLMTAPAGVARFDCDPITRNSLGLLIEESRVNSVLQSQTFDSATWAKNGGGTAVTVIPNIIIAPDGTLTGDKINEADGVTQSQVISQGVAVANSTAYTFSFYAKAAERSFVYTQAQGANNFQVVFNLTSGAVGVTSGTFTAATITPVGNNWYRCAVTATSTTTNVNWYIEPQSTNSLGTHLGVANKGIYIWGAQLEAGAFATSYIPTVASTVTRAADQASSTGTNFSSWYNQSQGSLCWEVDNIGISPSANYRVGGIYINGQNTGVLEVLIGSTGYYQTLNPTLSNGTLTNLVVSNKIFKIGLTASISNCFFTVNGIQLASNSGYQLASNVNSLFIGALGTGQQPYNGHIRKLSYYPVALSSSNLVALTS